jgi:hypothetical protein
LNLIQRTLGALVVVFAMVAYGCANESGTGEHSENDEEGNVKSEAANITANMMVSP